MSKTPASISSTTQEYLDIHDVVSDLVILKNGTTSLILTVNAVNFGLLAEAEQDAIIYAYAGLLNSLSFSMQILIRSQTKDVSDYVKQLDLQADQTLDERRKYQIRQYRQFVSEMIKERNVLDKKFYVVVSASALELGLVTAQSVIPGVKTTDVQDLDKGLILDKALNNLHPKRDHLIAQFARVGLFARQLATQEIIELFYLNYNPEAAEGQELTDTRNYTTGLVEADPFGGRMQDQATQPVMAGGTEPSVQPTPSQPALAVPVVPPQPQTTTPSTVLQPTQPLSAVGQSTTPTSQPNQTQPVQVQPIQPIQPITPPAPVTTQTQPNQVAPLAQVNATSPGQSATALQQPQVSTPSVAPQSPAAVNPLVGAEEQPPIESQYSQTSTPGSTKTQQPVVSHDPTQDVQKMIDQTAQVVSSSPQPNLPNPPQDPQLITQPTLN